MLSSGLPPLVLVLSVLELSWSLSEEEKKIILEEHNRYRSQVSPPARAMMKMSWDTQLEALAQAGAEKCIWKNNNESGQQEESLFAMAPTQDVKIAVKEWNEEKKFFSLITAKCAPGQICGNYKQLVWADTERVGCGAKVCEKMEGLKGENQRLLVCKYSPLGNKNGQKPYLKGPPCSRCPMDTACKNNLCEQRNVAGAPKTCSGLSLFLLPSAILVGFLL